MSKQIDPTHSMDRFTDAVLQAFDTISTAKPDLDQNTIAILVQAWAIAASATKLHGAIFTCSNDIKVALDDIDVSIDGVSRGVYDIDTTLERM